MQNAVWLTGASSGIGKALAEEFVKNNITVIGSSRRKELLSKLSKEFGVDNFIPLPLDVTNVNEVIEGYNKISKDYQITCLINNAGLTTFKLVEENSLDEIKEIVETNLLGSIYATKTVLPKMMKDKQGTIINILSAVTQKVFTKSSAYSASKSGLLAYSRVLREEVRDKNIRVINVIPGATKTPMWPNDALEKYSDRMMSPAEIAKLVYNVYSIKSNLVTEEIVLKPVKGDL